MATITTAHFRSDGDSDDETLHSSDCSSSEDGNVIRKKDKKTKHDLHTRRKDIVQTLLTMTTDALERLQHRHMVLKNDPLLVFHKPTPAKAAVLPSPDGVFAYLTKCSGSAAPTTNVLKNIMKYKQEFYSLWENASDHEGVPATSDPGTTSLTARDKTGFHDGQVTTLNDNARPSLTTSSSTLQRFTPGVFNTLCQQMKVLKAVPKATTIEKTRWGWRNFKEERKLEDELDNRRKRGYFSTQAFLTSVSYAQYAQSLNARRKRRLQEDRSAVNVALPRRAALLRTTVHVCSEISSVCAGEREWQRKVVYPLCFTFHPEDSRRNTPDDHVSSPLSTQHTYPSSANGTSQIKCIEYPDGSRYEGHVHNNVPHGFGKHIHASGNVYEGMWQHGKAEGMGAFTHVDGSRYDGEWKNNFQEGRGRETSVPNRTRYEGHYHKSKKHGLGKLCLEDGSFYVGQFHNDCIDGFGNYYWADGRTYFGDWSNNEMDGEGRTTWPDGRIYVGQYKQNKKSGQGVLKWSDGRSYAGGWLDGKKHGTGCFVDATGATRQGLWNHGTLLRWLS